MSNVPPGGWVIGFSPFGCAISIQGQEPSGMERKNEDLLTLEISTPIDCQSFVIKSNILENSQAAIINEGIFHVSSSPSDEFEGCG